MRRGGGTGGVFIALSSSDATLERAGGKGSNLAILTQNGFPVPPGFIITTETYESFVSTNQIRDRILTLVRSVSADDPVALDKVSNEVTTLFSEGHIPSGISTSIRSAYHEIAQNPKTAVAVRSSATAEDLPGLSFAGQQETYLNIVGVRALLGAVKKCWASLWTARAIGYRSRNGVPHDEVSLAVIVQQMIASEASGVLFTANPVTGHRGQMVINASLGLGEAIVSGQVDPDRYVVDSKWTIIEKTLGAKSLVTVPKEKGGTEQVRQDASNQQALSDEQIVNLARLAVRVAELFGTPQDIEWALASNELYLLQSRPITSLYPLPNILILDDDTGFFFSLNSIQGVPDPFTPLGQDMIRLLLGGLIRRVFGFNIDPHLAIVDAGDRLFFNLTEIVQHPVSRRAMLFALQRADPGARQIILRLIEAGRLKLKREHPLRVFKVMFRLVPRVAPGMIAALVSPMRERTRGLAVAEAFIARVRKRIQTVEPELETRLDLVESEVDRFFSDVLLFFIPAIFPAFAMISVIDRWLVQWCDAPPGSALSLLRGLSGNVTTEMNLKLWGVAKAILHDAHSSEEMRTTPVTELVAIHNRKALPGIAQLEIERFLYEYGMRAIAEIDIGRPRWRDDPSSVFQTLQTYLHLKDPEAAPDVVFRRGAAEADRLAREYVARARKGRLGTFRATLLEFVIGRIRMLAGGRETPKFYIIKLFDIIRMLLLEIGNELVQDGRLQRADNIFFVPLETLGRAGHDKKIDLEDVAAHNRTEYEREMTRRQLPRILLSTGETFYEGMIDSAASPDDLVGEAVSPGVGEGAACVVLDPRGTRLNPGEILVCPATDPGWTPLFLAAGGLVMEVGGMMTHGSVVAREYGIPAVVGVHEATTRLKTGQRVRVDGNAGRVKLLKALE